MKLDTRHAVAGLGLLVAGGIAYLATRSAGPVQLTPFTELREGPLQQHVVTTDGLLTQPVNVPHHYPARVGPGITRVISQGFAPLWQIPDPQVAALPAEQAW